MKGERLFRILGLIDEDLIEEVPAGFSAAPPRRTPWKRYLAAAACVTLVCGVSLAWLATGGFRGMGSSAPMESSGSSNGGSGHDEGAAFMSYAGPVFPLLLAEETDGLTAKRTITWDFAPSTFADGSPRQWGASVTDSYTLVNITDSDQTVTALYPFAGSFTELASQRPTVTLDG